jgi:hypothetical protein
MTATVTGEAPEAALGRRGDAGAAACAAEPGAHRRDRVRAAEPGARRRAGCAPPRPGARRRVGCAPPSRVRAAETGCAPPSRVRAAETGCVPPSRVRAAELAPQRQLHGAGRAGRAGGAGQRGRQHARRGNSRGLKERTRAGGRPRGGGSAKTHALVPWPVSWPVAQLEYSCSPRLSPNSASGSAWPGQAWTWTASGGQGVNSHRKSR